MNNFEFKTKLVERCPEDREKIKELKIFMSETEVPRILKGITFGDYHLSIQGSFGHYCSPRITTDIDDYTEMELAVIKAVDGKSVWTNLEDDEIFNDFPFIELFKRRNSTDGLYAYISVELIEELYQYLKEKVGETP